MSNNLNWKVAGFAGEGIMTTGLLFSKTCARQGFKIFDYTEYPSVIRGGHNTYQVYADCNEAVSQKKELDLLVCLNENAILFHKDELTVNSLVVYDKEDDKVEIEKHKLKGNVFNLPMVRLAKEAGGDRLMGNNVGLGASVFFLGISLEVLNGVIKDVFSRKGEDVVKLNQEAARLGYEFAKKNGKVLKSFSNLVKDDKRLTLTGNEAVGLGAIAGGLQMYVAYPMTPSSSVLHYLAKKASKANIVVKHAEDEIGTVCMALGASFAGARTMVGTSGGGFCYMTEALGLSGVAELPLVVFEAMRPGPALGMPTWTAQSDLLFAINASQDEFPRFVFTPGDAKEAFYLTKKALELAEKYQTLVIVLSDKYLAESRYTFLLEESMFNNQRFGIEKIPKLDSTGFYPRYKDSEDGMSNRSLPGTVGGNYIANSYEHDQYGLTVEDSNVRVEQMNKRQKKFIKMKEEIAEQEYHKADGASLTLISFGSTKGPIAAARKLLAEKSIVVNTLNLSWVCPFPKEQVKKVIEESGRVVVVEGNSYGQLANLITQETGVIIKDRFNKYDGRPFYPGEIVSFVEKIMTKEKV